MPAFHDLDQRWRLLVPVGAVVVNVRQRRTAIRQVRALPKKTVVTLVGGRRLRWLARRAGLHISADYLALPSLATPVMIAQRRPEALRFAARSVLTVPSGVTRWHLPTWIAVRMVRAVPGALGRVPAGDQLLVGTRR
jgi:hypothetical protein